MNIHITNLSLNVIDSDLLKLFAAFGEVNSAVIVRDKFNGRSKGTAFVDMVNEEQGSVAILNLHKTSIDGKEMLVHALQYNPSEHKN